jgi:hypothetical protein
MKLKTYKSIGFLIAAFFISGLQAQKFDKKYNETFKVNKDVLVQINASNADINVTTWNRNEVAVEAIITVEGLSKRDAQEFLKSWKFEALGNSRKVEVNANANRFLSFGKNDFNFNFDFSDIVIPEINLDDIKIEIPEFEMPEIVIPEINIPEINIDFDSILDEIDDYDFDKDDDDDGIKTFTYKKNGKKKKVVIKSKKEWEKFKKSSEYQDFKDDLRRTLKKAQDQIKNIDTKKIHEELKKAKIRYEKIDKKKIEEQIKKAKLQYKKIDKEKIKASLAKAKASIEKMKVKMANKYRNGDNVIVIEDEKGKRKIKITRKITIKVPKNAKFDLNTRHSKVKLPKGKVSGKVSYGTFNADEINGGDLNIYYSPVDVKRLSESTLSLNNITDATIASVMNSKLVSNSTGLKINTVNNEVDITSKFGELLISEILSGLSELKLNLNFSDATVNFKNLREKLKYSQVDDVVNTKSKNVVLNGNFSVNNSKVNIKGRQSKLTIKKQ